MKIIIDWQIYTDGDFYLENYEKYDLKRVEDDLYAYSGIRVFDNTSDIDCMMEARDFLEEMLCDMRVLPNHYYILHYLYKVFDSLIRFVCAREPGAVKEHMPGNYDNTRCFIYILD